MQQNLEKISKFCIVANPRITDIAFGCRIVALTANLDKIAGIVLDVHENSALIIFGPVEGRKNVTWVGLDRIIENHGRPIRLADLLLAKPSRSVAILGIWPPFDDDSLENKSEATLKLIANLI